jgi:lipoprotein-anchoring transpeptidase ErfK/SrfK
VNSLKTMFLAVLMSAATYGVYVTITGNPPGSAHRDPPKEWEEEPPKVEQPAEPVQDSASAASPALVERADNSSRSASPPPSAASFTADDANDASSAYVPGGQDRYTTPDGVDEAERSVRGKPSGSLGSRPDRYPSPDDRSNDVGPYRTTGRDLEADRFQSGNRDASSGRYPDTAPPERGAPVNDASSITDDDPVQIHEEFVARMQMAHGYLAQGQLVDALLELSKEVGVDLAPSDEGPLMELLDQLAGTVVYSREHHLEPAYEVQPGDTLERIAEAYQVPWQLLANINDIADPRRQLRPGEQIKVVKGPFEAVVDLRRFRLTIFVRDCYAGRFSIGVGKDLTTPEGTFAVQKKLIRPTYYGETTIEGGSPENPMGEYALELGDHIYIHGTNDPSSIGRAASKGCIRLSERDIADLFAILSEKTERSPGSTVYIQR